MSHRYTGIGASGGSPRLRSSGPWRFVFSSSEDLTRDIATTSGTAEKLPESWLRGIAQSLFATIFPSECRLCNAFLANISRLPVCDECLSAIRPMEGNLCAICGERLPNQLLEGADGMCGMCRKERPSFAVAAAFGSYEAELRDLIHLLKYDKVQPAADVLGKMLAGAIAKVQPLFARGKVLVVSVPLHSRKLRERGFNQAELIARAAVKRSSFRGQLELETRLLKRRRITESQIGLSQNQRRENLRGAFTVAKREGVEGREVLLVHDVLTTGTTASECARVLRRAGASKVWVATVARTLKRSVQSEENLESNPVAMAG